MKSYIDQQISEVREEMKNDKIEQEEINKKTTERFEQAFGALKEQQKRLD